MIQGAGEGGSQVSIVKGEEVDQMAAVAPRVEFGLGLGAPKAQLVTLNEDSKKVSGAHPHFAAAAYCSIEQRGAPFVTLATQDFLQPMERSVGEGLIQANGGEIPLQLSSLAGDPASADHLSRESRIQFHNLRMQYGFMGSSEQGKAGLESAQQSSAANRHWQQQQQGASNSNSSKRPRSAQSEGDETDDGDRRSKKIHQKEAVIRDEANSRSADAKGSASRSKHSATEQRRRSKINDRFQMLRDLLPHGDQKRDKASFLLEVIEYVQTLQEKVKAFEAMERGRQSKTMAWETHASCTSLKETPVLIDAGKEKNSYYLAGSSPTQNKNHHPRHHDSQPLLAQIPAEEDLTHQHRDRSKASTSKPESKQEKSSSRAATCQGDETKVENSSLALKNGQQKLTVKQGVISLSTAYSQGLLETLTTALQNSGLDLSKANISVQIELGKPCESQTEAPV